MSITPKLPKLILTGIFVVVSICPLQLDAMEKFNFKGFDLYNKIEEQLSKLKILLSPKTDAREFKTISEMMPYLTPLESLASTIPPEIRKHIALDFFYIQTVPEILVCLKKNLQDPEAVLIMINHLHESYQDDTSAHLLRVALKNANMCIGDIKTNKQENLLVAACAKRDHPTSLPSIKIILDVAGDEALCLASSIVGLFRNIESSAWSMAVLCGYEDFVKLFLALADDRAKLSNLLFSAKFQGGNVFETVIYLDYAIILNMIFEQADKVDMISELMLMESDTGTIGFRMIEYCSNVRTKNQRRKKILDTIKCYCEKYQLDDLLVQLKDL